MFNVWRKRFLPGVRWSWASVRRAPGECLQGGYRSSKLTQGAARRRDQQKVWVLPNCPGAGTRSSVHSLLTLLRLWSAATGKNSIRQSRGHPPIDPTKGTKGHDRQRHHGGSEEDGGSRAPSQISEQARYRLHCRHAEVVGGVKKPEGGGQVLRFYAPRQECQDGSGDETRHKAAYQ